MNALRGLVCWQTSQSTPSLCSFAPHVWQRYVCTSSAVFGSCFGLSGVISPLQVLLLFGVRHAGSLQIVHVGQFTAIQLGRQQALHNVLRVLCVALWSILGVNALRGFVCWQMSQSRPRLCSFAAHVLHRYAFTSSAVFGSCFGFSAVISPLQFLLSFGVRQSGFQQSVHVGQSEALHGGLQQVRHTVLRFAFDLLCHILGAYSARGKSFLRT